MINWRIIRLLSYNTERVTQYPEMQYKYNSSLNLKFEKKNFFDSASSLKNGLFSKADCPDIFRGSHSLEKVHRNSSSQTFRFLFKQIIKFEEIFENKRQSMITKLLFWKKKLETFFCFVFSRRALWLMILSEQEKFLQY